MYMLYAIIMSVFGKLSFWVIVLGVIGIVQKRSQGELPEWRRLTLTREQQILVNTQYRAYKEDIYKDYPKVEQFEKKKKIWAGCLTFLHFLAIVLPFFAVPVTPFSIGVGIILCIVGCVIIFGVFVTVMGPNRKYAFILYVIALGQVISFWRMMGGSLFMILAFLQHSLEDFWNTPLQTGALCLPLINAVITLLTAVYLTAFKRNRKLAEQSDALDRKIRRDFMSERIDMDM